MKAKRRRPKTTKGKQGKARFARLVAGATHFVQLFKYSIDALFGIFVFLLGDFARLVAQHLIDCIHDIVHLLACYIAVVVHVVQFEGP